MRPVTSIRADTGEVTRSKVRRETRCACGQVKQAYSSRKVAKQHARIQSKATGEQIEAYHCFPGHTYHLGHVPGTERAPRQRRRAS